MDKYGTISIVIDVAYIIIFMYLLFSKKKFNAYAAFVIGWCLSLASCHYGLLSYSDYCKNNSVSIALVETTAEYTDMKEIDIAKFYNIASENGWELEEVIHYLDNSLSDEEINTIILKSYYKEQ